ncbi:SCE4755 family polysaccharide monooxygenase-like protein [Sorangium sp. So ce1335]|uniref:SCE4755 family polysaccharide monooxygenase-like protein n=1 Tax=Sorangium sp. So ce1335 TaxID=3133335 RepID=UPI003F61883C
MRRVPLGSFVFAAVVSLAGVSHAHITLTSPAPRNGLDGPQKTSPCGAPNDARGDDVTVFEPGETITVTWDETIDHPGHFRIMFDDDGDDFPEPAGESDLCEPGVDPGCLLDGIEDKRGGSYSAQVTLPDIACDNCTLQLIQVMTDRRPATLYYRCADLVLRSSGGDPGATTSAASTGAGTGGGDATAASSSAATGAGGGAATTGAAGSTGATGAGEGAATGAGGAGGADEGSGADTEGGGGCSFGGAGGAPVGAALGSLAALALAARGRRRARPAPRKDAAGAGLRRP